MNNESNYTLGVIKWYSDENRYGVIEEVNTHKEVFLHFKNWVDNYSMTNITISQVLVFEVAEEKNKITAKKCRFFDYSKKDYMLLYTLTFMYEHYLYVKGESNRETKIVNILNNKHSQVKYFIEILNTIFQDVQNVNFLEEIKKLENLFNSELISKEFIMDESLKRFKLSSDNEFKLQLIEQDYINIYDVEFSFILEYLEIDLHLLNKIKNHPQFLENIFHILDKLKNKVLKKELIEIAIENNLQDITKHIDKFFHSLNQDEFIDSLLEIKDRLDSSDIIYDIDSTVSECLTRINNKKITYDAYKKKLINLSELDIVENYIDFIAEDELLNIIRKNIKDTRFVETIFASTHNKLENKILKKEILKIAIENNLQSVTKYIDDFCYSLTEDYFVDTLIEIKDGLDKSEIIYDINSTIQKYLTNLNSKKVTYQAHKKKLINLSELDIVENYIDFIAEDELLNIIRKNNKNTDLIEIIFTSINNQELLRFLIEKIEEFELQNYKIYFDFGVKNLTKLDEENQVLYLKKLFHLKKINLLNFSNTDLVAFYNIKVIKEASINSHDKDFSTFLIIDLLTKFNETDDFLATNELIKSVLNIIESTPDKKVQIGEYFDECDGSAKEVVPNKLLSIESDLYRLFFPYDESMIDRIKNFKGMTRNNQLGCWEIPQRIGKDVLEYTKNEFIYRIISKESFVTQQGQTNYYFKITFEYNENIVNDIKNIPGRKYNQVEKFWGAPLKSQKEVVDFGKKHNFLIKLNDGNYIQDNSHLLKIEKNYKEQPKGIVYCCGQKSNVLSTLSQKEFWWCNNSPCFQNNINHHQNWKEYTLFDLMNILDFSMNEQKKDGSIINNGLYTRFVAFINRFNRLLEKLYCNECNHILYPVESSNFAAYSVTKFICKNDNCSCKNQIIYLNHCLNPQCNATIDSRVSKKCNNNWYICNECGSCCSHATYERRLNNLNTTTGQVYEELLFAVNNKIGHLEKAEYFCYTCGQVMVEYSKNKFKCRDCNIDYNLSEYSQIEKQWIHKNLRSKNYPTILNTLIPQFRQILLNEKQELLQQGRQRNQIFGILYNKVIELEDVSLCLKEINDKQLTNSIFD